MKTKKQKAVVIKDLVKKIPQSEMVVFTSFSQEGEKGLSVTKMRELRKVLKKTGAEYVVVKKKLVHLSIKQAHFEDLVNVNGFTGSVGLVLSGQGADGIELSKNVYEFTKSHPIFKVLGALFERQYVDPTGFITLAKLPSREVLISRTVGMIQHPLRGLLNVLQGNLRNLVGVLSNIKKI